MKRGKSFLCLLAFSGLADSGWGADLGRITFVGDSITQGFDSSINSSPQASYRYQFWKGLVDNGFSYGNDYSFAGSQYGSCHNDAADLISSLTPDYRNQSFSNIHEGHFNWNASYISGSAAPPAADLEQNRGTGSIGQWLAPQNPDGYTADTVFIMLGTNDLAKGRTPDQLLGDIRSIVEAYQKSNGNARIYVMSITPPSSSAGTSMMNQVQQANAAMEAQASSWSTRSSNVSYMDVTKGMSAVTSGSQAAAGLMNIDKWHPTSQGELIIAGNILKELGLESQTGGLQRKTAADMAVHASLPPENPPTRATGNLTVTGDGEQASWTFSSSGATLSWSGNATGTGPALQGEWNASGGDFTLDFRISMDLTGNANNTFSVQLGNGTAFDGLLNIREQGVFWGDALLYSDGMDGEFRNIRIAYTQGNKAEGILEGYYVWLDGQLIGNGLHGDSSSGIRDQFLMGAVDGLLPSSAMVKDIFYDTSGAFAFDSKTVPEPSSISLGLLAAGWLGWRRKAGK